MNETNLKPESMDIVADNIEKIKTIFPDVFSENKVDFEKLQEVLGEYIEDKQERYNFTWNGKSKALRLSQTPSTGTLRPCPEETESKNWDTTENLYIEGDNLEVLKLLQKTYHGKIKLIYIDPPYNTGGDFVYKDDFKDNLQNYLELTGQKDFDGNKITTNSESNGRYHSNWLNMMYPRLRLARNLLSEDGAIFISIDEKEVGNLRKVCHEIFGEDNCAGEIIWKNSSKNDQNYISIQHEYILVAVKNKEANKGNWVEKKEGLDEIYKAFEGFKKQYGKDWKRIHEAALEWYKQFPASNPIKDSKHYSWMDEEGVYFPADISGPNFGQYRYDVYHPVTGKVCKEPASGWRYPEETMTQRVKDNLVHFGDDETTVPNNKTYLKNTECQSLTSIKYKDGRVASKQLDSLFGSKVFSNPKDVELLARLFKAVEVEENDIVLDFFSGSSSTAQAIMQLNQEDEGNRKFIMVQLPENLDESLKTGTEKSKKIIRSAIKFLDSIKKTHYLSELGKERIRRAGDKIKEEIESKNQQLKLGEGPKKIPDIGFKVLKLDTSNIKKWTPDADNLQQSLDDMINNYVAGRTELDVVYEIMLKYGIDLTFPIETLDINSKKVYSIGFGQLVICLDSEITADIANAIIDHKKEKDVESMVVVFRDNGFKDDSIKTNIKEILKVAEIKDFVTV